MLSRAVRSCLGVVQTLDEVACHLLHGPRWPPLALEAAAVQAPGSTETRVRAAADRVDGEGDAVTGSSSVEAAELFGFSILYGGSKKMRGVHGTFNPSLWKWYHRHGYWATRRKKIGFGAKRKYRYNQYPGDGKRGMTYAARFCQWWQDPSYYKPLKNYCRF